MFAALLAVSATARAGLAQDAPPTGSGTTGGVLLGAEAVLVGEAVSGVRPLWAYALGGVGGAAAGGVGGYLAEARAKPDVSLYLFAAGFGLLIPTIVWLGETRAPRADRRPFVSLRFGVPAPAEMRQDAAVTHQRFQLVPPDSALSVSLVSGTF